MDDWKADMLMGLYYSQWADRPRAANLDISDRRIKEEVTESSSSSSKPSKRPQSISAEQSTHESKKPKVDIDSVDIVMVPSGSNTSEVLQTYPKIKIARALASPKPAVMPLDTTVFKSTETIPPTSATAFLQQMAASFNMHKNTDSEQSGAATDAAVTTGQEKTKKKCSASDGTSLMRPSSSSVTARNLYVFEWVKANKGGTVAQYAECWSRLVEMKDPIVVKFNQQANTVKETRKKAAEATTQVASSSVNTLDNPVNT
ncbi:hypothetical protein PAXINDRAFT_14904 [Paxillus involutus ATCC 200175]|uniref:Uncharacterized protein n=1 Tax=Paxillus involutus ATCC 200175 TaxID=664439 RepID=A0A0C9T9I2_PAXIN|nr:hypothetical protein PAXINDRAFT_14904 [Paxillus involutus ATCC 200175]